MYKYRTCITCNNFVINTFCLKYRYLLVTTVEGSLYLNKMKQLIYLINKFCIDLIISDRLLKTIPCRHAQTYLCPNSALSIGIHLSKCNSTYKWPTKCTYVAILMYFMWLFWPLVAIIIESCLWVYWGFIMQLGRQWVQQTWGHLVSTTFYTVSTQITLCMGES